MNLWQKLVEIRKSIDGFTKDTQGFGYKYVSGTQVLAKIHNQMDELGVLLVPETSSELFHDKHYYTNAKNKEVMDFIIKGSMTYRWINAESPEETLACPWHLFGQQDDISKAFGSALTYSERYFLMKFFNVPTDADDPDARNTKGNSHNNAQKPLQQKFSGGNTNTPKRENEQPKSQTEITEKQIKMIAAKSSAVAKLSSQSQVVVEEHVKATYQFDSFAVLTAQQASEVIKYLESLETRYVKKQGA